MPPSLHPRRRRKIITGTIYLLHFSRPYKHAKHYVGWTSEPDVLTRIQRHLAGNGARLLSVITAAGITFTVAKTWTGTRSDERKFKKQKNTIRHCPICQSAPATVYGTHTHPHYPVQGISK